MAVHLLGLTFHFLLSRFESNKQNITVHLNLLLLIKHCFGFFYTGINHKSKTVKNDKNSVINPISQVWIKASDLQDVYTVEPVLAATSLRRPTLNTPDSCFTATQAGAIAATTIESMSFSITATKSGSHNIYQLENVNSNKYTKQACRNSSLHMKN